MSRERGGRREGAGRTASLAVLAAILLAAGAQAALGGGLPPQAGERERCPVCGMFVAGYPDFLSAVRFRDGGHAWFDGPKDLFRYLLGMRRYAPARRPEDVEAVFVKDYYSLEFIDGRTAFYAEGSDVYGPMGRELVPFEREKEARQFLRDHKGRSLYRFGEITAEVLGKLR
ncbi:MAG TPA: nitrous oxide reductase accessory protein NosL [Candidatus Deferrimicrobiaceae bacterium]